VSHYHFIILSTALLFREIKLLCYKRIKGYAALSFSWIIRRKNVLSVAALS